MSNKTECPRCAELKAKLGNVNRIAKDYKAAYEETYANLKSCLQSSPANALSSAAPDLLEALREIEVICTESAGDCRKRMGTRLGNIIVAARAAIAKAEGRQ